MSADLMSRAGPIGGFLSPAASRCVALLALLASATVGAAPAIAPPAGTTAAMSNPLANDYHPGPGDVIRITVYRAPEYDTLVQIAGDGTIPFSSLGRIFVEGMPPSAIAQEIARRLVAGGIFVDPVVNVMVQEYHSRTVMILGAVARPGEYPLERGGLRISDILARAGAPLTTTGGTLRIINGGSADATSEELRTADVVSGVGDRPVRSHETIYVREAAMFYMSGEVQRPGSYPIEPRLTVGRAIALAGGLTPRGAQSKIRITRRTGEEEADERLKGRVTDLVNAGDLIVVGARIF